MTIKVGVIGGSGHIGSEIVKALSERGATVLAVARDPSKIVKAANVTAIAGDAQEPEALSEKLKGIDVLITALFFDVPVEKLLAIAKATGAKRIISVGGAGTLKPTEDGPYLVNTPDFPEEYKPYALPGVKFLEDYRKVDDYNWLLVSPPLLIDDFKGTGKYLTGKDILLTDENGDSKISYADFALGIADEVGNNKHAKTRITFVQSVAK